MVIKTKLTEQDLLSFNYHVLYRHLFMKLLTVIAILSLVAFFITMAIGNKPPDASALVFPLIVLLALPLFVYFGAKKSYRTNE